MNINDEQAVINHMIDEELDKFNLECKDVKATESRLRQLFARLKQLEKEHNAAQTHNNM